MTAVSAPGAVSAVEDSEGKGVGGGACAIERAGMRAGDLRTSVEAGAAGAEGEVGMGDGAVARERTWGEVRGILRFWGCSGGWGEWDECPGRRGGPPCMLCHGTSRQQE